MKAKFMVTGLSQSWYGFDYATMTTFESVAPEVSDETTTLVLAFRESVPIEKKKDIIFNYVALLSKSWHFLFPTVQAPINPWSGLSAGVELGTRPGSCCYDCEDGTVKIRLGSKSALVLQTLVWKMGNAFEWCMLPDRKCLSGSTKLSRETWNAISIRKDAHVLRRQTVPDMTRQESEVFPED